MKRFAIAAGVAAAVVGAAVVLERRLIAAPHYSGPRSDHFDGERFHNHQSGWQSEGSFLKWQLTKNPTPWPDWIETQPGPPPPARVDDAIRITVINHATTLIQAAGVNVLTDPIWSDRCSPVSFTGPMRHRAPGIRFADLPQIDVVLISHNHYDHLDLPTLRNLQSRFNPLIVSHLGNSALMARHGVDGARDLDWWKSTDTKGITITSVPAQHFSARGISDRDATLWGGFVISTRAGHIYFAGDTGWGKHFEEIAQRFAPIRLALLPIGAYLPRWFMKPAHITPAEAVDAHLALKAQTSVPMHYGTWALGDDGYTQPVEDLSRAIAAKRVTGFEILEFGRGLDLR